MKTTFTVLGLCCLFTLLTAQTSGALDPSFGTNGRTLTNVNGLTEEVLWGILEQSDGKIVVGGTTNLFFGGNIIIARYSSNGQLDPSFGNNGINEISPGAGNAQAFGYALTADDKILTCGSYGDAFFLMQLTADGELDTSFAGDGIREEANANERARGTAISLQADGKILVAGFLRIFEEPNDRFAFLVYRYLPNGEPDETFGVNGRVAIDTDSNSSMAALALTVQPDDKILVTGQSRNNGINVATFRLHPDGSLDDSFGETGLVYTSLSISDDQGRSIYTLPDSSIIVGGRTLSTSTTHNDFAILKYDYYGQLDTTFGDNNGWVTTNLPGSSTGLFNIHPVEEGKILATGMAVNGGTRREDLALVRYLPDGTLDPDFGNNGIRLIDFDASNDWLYSTILSQDGERILGAGRTNDTPSGNFDAMVVGFYRNNQPEFNLAGIPSGGTHCASDTVNLSLSISVLAGFAEEVVVSVVGLPTGAIVIPGENQTLVPPAEVPLSLLFTDTPSGTYTIDIVASSGEISKSMSYTATVINETPGIASLSMPVDGAVLEAGDIFLEWSETSAIARHYLELSSDPNFGDAIFFDRFANNGGYFFIESTFVLEPGVHYWRVRSELCGQIAYSAVRAFQVTPGLCTFVRSDDVPLFITNVSLDTVTSTLLLNEAVPAGTESLRVYIENSHVRPGDLRGSLTAPNGTTVELFDRPGVPATTFGCDDGGMRVTFYDSAPNPNSDIENICESVGFAIEGEFQPLLGNMNDMITAPTIGEWQLTLTDERVNAGGFLNNWRLEFCQTPPPIPVITLVNNEAQVVIGTTITLGLDQLNAEVSNGGNELNFVLRSVPALGNLKRSSTNLTIGDTLTLADLNQGIISYEHEGTDLTPDQFRFDIYGPDNSWLGNQTLSINVVNISTTENELPAGIIKIFPNPGTGIFQFSSRIELADLRIGVYNAQGTLLKKLSNTEQTIDLTGLPSGTYWLHFTSNNGNALRQVVLQ